VRGSIAVAVSEALRLRRAGKIGEALKHFRRLSLEHSNDAITRFHLAETLDNLGKERQAIPHYHRALRLNPKHPHRYELLLYLSSSYRKTERPRAAARYLACAESMRRKSDLQTRLRRLIDRDLLRVKRYNRTQHGSVQR
jgi:Flp pilus assembly protein TadD